MEAQLKSIQDKLQQLLRQQASLQKENRELKEALKKLKMESGTNQEYINGLRQKVEILKISSGNWNDTDKKQFEKRVSSYIREIDRCIALLSE
ncbi:MAG: hypothetical protein GC171_08035 [Terrimonas sp.]|nr:hypothetical protein [Terrimonas sp.]